jgi:hypothetical protein
MNGWQNITRTKGRDRGGEEEFRAGNNTTVQLLTIQQSIDYVDRGMGK